jgi:hypothetical protein
MADKLIDGYSGRLQAFHEAIAGNQVSDTLAEHPTYATVQLSWRFGKDCKGSFFMVRLLIGDRLRLWMSGPVSADKGEGGKKILLKLTSNMLPHPENHSN